MASSVDAAELIELAELTDVFVHAVILLNHRRMSPLDLDYLNQADASAESAQNSQV